MTNDIAISLQNISKCFKRYHHPSDRLKELFFANHSHAQEFWALKDINLSIPKGKTVGILGRNGSGKSTLLQIIAGTLTPTTGTVQVHGRVSALLELGSGFNPEFTGIENIFFNGQLLGLRKQEIEDKLDEIISFADIGDFIEQPVKTYSSGMFVRLAFAVAVNVSPEILIVDEALAVGDVSFQHRCMRRIRKLMDSGVTTLFVSHDAGAIKTLCNSAIMIHDGVIQRVGNPNQITTDYLRLMTEIELEIEQRNGNNDLNAVVGEVSPEEYTDTSIVSREKSHSQEKSQRIGSGKARIEEIRVFNGHGERASKDPVFAFGEEVAIITHLRAYTNLDSCIIGFFVCDKNGNEVIGSNTLEEGMPIGPVANSQTVVVSFKFKLPLRPGSYSLTVAGAESYNSVTFDWVDNAIVFQVLPPDTGKNVHALIDHPMLVDIQKLELEDNHQMEVEKIYG
ncbi:MAG: ABC transporter ATP-binding protein [Synechococcales cyanobacterium CRU_2_2]|nr:ABC transporter ATP-binding protein [Synechococcales cyanobacterium CRU_2_2]